MNWVLLSICSAVLQAGNDALSKRKLRTVSTCAMAWAPFPISFIFLLPLIAYQGVPEIGPTFTRDLLIVSCLDAAAVLLCISAIQSSDLSLVLPIQMCTPIFMLVTSPLMLDEYPSLLGCCGVLLIVFGSYVLNIHQARKGLLGPFKAIFRERGPRFMFFGAMIWSVAWNLHKSAVAASSPSFYIMAHQAAVALIMGVVLLLRKPEVFAEVRRHLPFFTVIAVSVSIMFLFQMTALQSGFPVYVAAIKRTSVLIGVVVGALLFKEIGLRHRLTGAGIMIGGVFLTAL